MKYLRLFLLGLLGFGLLFDSETLKSALPTHKEYTTPIQCTGDPHYDVRCSGAVGDGTTDDAAAINSAGSIAITNNWPLFIPRKTFHIASAITFTLSSTGQFTLISDGATLDGSGITGASAVNIFCGTHGSPLVCQYSFFKGLLFVKSAASGNFGVQIGFGDFVDAFIGMSIEHLVVTNTGTGGACFMGFVVRSKVRLTCTSTTTGSGLTIGRVDNTVFQGPSLISSAGSALTSSGSTSYANTFESPYLSGATGMTISGNSSSNTILSADFLGSTTPINATNGTANLLSSPNYTTSLGTNFTGISILNDPVNGDFASIPAAVGLPQVRVGGALTKLGVTTMTFAPVTAPTSPASGWTDYVDSADGKRKTKKSTGTVRTLAQ